MERKVKEYIFTTIGFIIVVIAVKFFLEPNNIAGGGVMGIAIVLHKFLPVSVGVLMLAMNLVLFIIAFIVIGNQFGAKTIYASLGLSGSISILDNIIGSGYIVTSNLLLATIFGTLLSGVGMGIVFNQNASTGGTDILAKIINKFWHLDIGKSLLMVDFCVTLAASATFGAEIGMYSLLSVIINGIVIDTVIEGLNLCKSVTVISSKNQEISKYITHTLDRGCTIIHGKGGYTGSDTYILYTVLSRKEFIKLRNYIKEVDKRAFITISNAHEVLGEGFNNIDE